MTTYDEAGYPVENRVDRHVDLQVYKRVRTRTPVPKILTDRDTARAAAAWTGRRAAVVGVHTSRAGTYYARLVARSPIGLARLITWLTRWVLDAESRPVRSALGAAVGLDGNHAAHLVRLTEQRSETLKRRGIGVGVAALVLLVVVPQLVAAMPWWGQVLLFVVVTAALGYHGRAKDRPISTHTTVEGAAPRLTGDLILTALGSLGIAELNKNIRNGPDAVRFVSPVTRDGAGWRADLDLPAGVTAGDIQERRDRLASGLRRPEGCVWPEGDPSSHAGRLVLYVSDRSLSATRPAPWPLLTTGTVDFFAPFAFGSDQRGRPVTICLAYASMIIGSISRMGKTASLRLLLLGVSLDPRVEIHAHNLKPGNDLVALDLVAHYNRTGDAPEDLAALVATLRYLKKDQSRRYGVMRTLSREQAPDAKVTSALADDRPLGLHPIVVGLDECQIAFEDPKYGAEIEALVTDLSKRGPAVGISVLLATQRVDGKSLPRSISSNAVLRLCLKVTGQVENDLVLGTSAYKAGTRATMFSRKDLGVAWLSGEGDDPTIVRASYVDLIAADPVAARSRALREQAGRLTGQAAGLEQDVEVDTSTVLDHLVQVWPGAVKRETSARLAELLAEHSPAYEGWTAEQVTLGVAAYDVPGVQVSRRVNGAQVNRRGVSRADLDKAITERS